MFAPFEVAAQAAPDLATRDALFDQARLARRANDHTSAVDLATRAGQIAMTTDLRRFLAEENEAVGDLGTALTHAQACVSSGEADSGRSARAATRACHTLVDRLTPRVGRLRVQVPSPRPDGLNVTVSGHAISPVMYDLPSIVTPGALVVRATAPGMTPFEQTVSVTAGGVENVHIELAPATPAAAATTITPIAAPIPSGTPAAPVATGSITVTVTLPPGVDPATVRVLVDDVPLAPGIRAASLAPGSHRIRAEAYGARAPEATVAIGPGETRDFAVTLTPVPGRLRVATVVAGAEVRVDNVVVGRTPVDAFELAPGHHVVDVSGTGYAPWHREVDVAAEATLDLGTVRLASPMQDPVRSPDATATSRGLHPVGFVFMGIGVVAGLAALPLRLVGDGQYASLRESCMTRCTTFDAVAQREGIETLDTAATAMLVTGGVIFAVGGILAIAVRSERPAASRPQAFRWAPYVNASGGGIVGSF